MEFPLEKILSASARDYAESKGKSLKNYELKGIHYIGKPRYADTGEGAIFLRPDKEILAAFSGAVPENTEVVTDFRISLRTSTYGVGVSDIEVGYAYGTALIPISSKTEK